MFDFDLAELYDAGTRILKQTVRRNIHRFPDDFFKLSIKDWKELITICDNLQKSLSYVSVIYTPGRFP